MISTKLKQAGKQPKAAKCQQKEQKKNPPKIAKGNSERLDKITKR